MRSKLSPEINEIRMTRVFLWFPKTLKDYFVSKNQTRWLEKAEIQQSYSYVNAKKNSRCKWKDEKWFYD